MKRSLRPCTRCPGGEIRKSWIGKKIDGIFPILCADEVMTAKAALEAYTYQPRLEKRFCQLKSVHNVAPTLFKKVERVEAIMLLFFFGVNSSGCH